MKPPSTVESAPQSLTLSLRISEVLRKRLEDIRQFTAKRTGGIVSTSEIAKQLLEAAREDRLEVVDLLARPTASLLTILWFAKTRFGSVLTLNWPWLGCCGSPKLREGLF